MDEAEYCHRLALMYRGRVIALGTPAELKQSLRRSIICSIWRSSDLLASMKLLESAAGSVGVAVFGGGLHVTVEDAARAIPEIRAALEQAGIQIEPAGADPAVAWRMCSWP